MQGNERIGNQEMIIEEITLMLWVLSLVGCGCWEGEEDSAMCVCLCAHMHGFVYDL